MSVFLHGEYHSHTSSKYFKEIYNTEYNIIINDKIKLIIFPLVSITHFAKIIIEKIEPYLYFLLQNLSYLQ